MTGFCWTAERDDRLRALRAAGKSFSYIGADIGCGRNSAIGRAHRIGVSVPRPRSAGGRPARPRPVTVPKQKPWSPPSNPEPGIPAELPPQRSRPPAGKPCGIMEVTGCRYITGDVRGEHSYCNAPRIEGVSYCPEHAVICFGRQP